MCLDHMQKVKQFFSKIWASDELRRKVGFTLMIFVVARLLASVPLPLIDTAMLQTIFANDEFLSLLNIVAGGTLSSFSLVAVGISPYITASIVIQLLTFVWPALKEMQKDGEKGRAQLNQYTRVLSLPVAIIQSLSMIAILRSTGLIAEGGWQTVTILVFFMTVGSFIMLWLSELIGAHGIGNGTSMIMVLGIISNFPTTLGQVWSLSDTGEWMQLILIIVGIVAVVGVIVLMDQAVRKVVIQYAKRIQGNRQVGGQTSFFPIKLNSVGVMPIIFAVTLMSIPSFVGRALSSLQDETWVKVGDTLQQWFSQTNPWYMVAYFLIVFVFSYFSALLFFDTKDISEELKKSGAFVPGIRPGGKTAAYLETIVKRLTFVDGIFLGAIAILPFVLQRMTGMSNLAIGGTSLLIAVSVVLEVNKIVEGTAVEQNYDQYL